jgi:hypothetical protein
VEPSAPVPAIAVTACVTMSKYLIWWALLSVKNTKPAEEIVHRQGFSKPVTMVDTVKVVVLIALIVLLVPSGTYATCREREREAGRSG